mgnify:CR=1 FL=1
MAGSLLAGAFPDPAALGFDFALPAMFIGLVAGRLTAGGEAAVAGLAVLGTLAGARFLPANWNVIVAAALAAAAGMFRR